MTAAREASIAALPPGPRRALEIALWTKRIVAGPRRAAFVIDGDRSDEDVAAITDLARAVRVELLGGGR